jgi:D-inositol-3-phosphate glycosyltransferase
MNVYVRELSAELGRRGIFVDVFTRSQDPCIPHINEVDLGDCARVVHIPAGPESPLSTIDVYPHLQEFTENVEAFALEEGLKYDLIHSHYWLSGVVARTLKRTWNVPFIQMFHTLGRMKNRIAGIDGDMEDELRVQTEHQLMQQADRLVAATPAERIQLMWLYNAESRKIQTISPGVDVSQFYPIPRDQARRVIGIPEEDHLLLFVGRIEPLKGIDTLLRAIALLRSHMPGDTAKLSLSIIGGLQDEEEQSDEMKRLRNLREELGLSELVTFLGAKSQETLQYYYSAAEAVVMPSHYESFGMVALEAMACGTPVIASEVGGLAYLVQDGVTGFHVPTSDPVPLADKIQILLTSDVLRREMSNAAHDWAHQYSWQRITDQIQDLYIEALRMPESTNQKRAPE